MSQVKDIACSVWRRLKGAAASLCSAVTGPARGAHSAHGGPSAPDPVPAPTPAPRARGARPARARSSRGAHTANSRRRRVIAARGAHSAPRAPRPSVPVNLNTAPAAARGYSMAEVLATVAIILILGSLVVMNVVSFQANLRQKALDAKAEIIYTAAQEQMTRIMASGREDVMAAPIEEPPTDTYTEPSKHLVRYIPASGAIPGDVTQDSVDPWHICYVTSEELNIDGTEPGNPNNSDISGANLLFGRGGLDDELLNGHWVIEYDYKSLTVYSVYYSEGNYNCASSDEGYASDSFKEAFNRELRSHAFRLEANKTLGSGNFVGYYGGGATSANAGTSLKPSVKISNGEKLTATITATLPMMVSADAAFMVTLTDSYGNSTRAYYCMAREKDLFNNSIGIPVYAADLTGEVDDASNATFTCKGLDYKLELTLDSLEGAGSMRFTKLYGSQSLATELDAPAAAHPLVEGSDLRIEVQAICERSALVGTGRGTSATFNSLFDDGTVSNSPSTNVAAIGSGQNSVAGISCGRHLQNLDQSSGLNASRWRDGSAASVPYFTMAHQDASFDFDNSISGDTEFKAWLSTYGTGYFNGVDDDGKPRFKPIVNSNLESFSGRAKSAAPDASGSVIAHLNIKEDGDAALFAGGTSMQALKSLSNITLTGPTVQSTGGGTQSAAGLIAVNTVGGAAGGDTRTLTIDNCQLYLNPNKDISEPADDPTPWITGSTTGGLVGTNRGNLTIANSSASTVVHGTGAAGIAGGLVGSNMGTLTIERSYADSYLKAHSTGGLVGSGVATVRYSYAAGYLFMPGEGSAAAGLVNGIAKIDNSYAAMTVQNTLPESYEYYRTSKSGETHTKVLYLDTELTKSNGVVDKPQSAVTGDEPFLSTASPESVLERIGENPENPANFTLAAASISSPYNLMNQGLDSYTWPTIVTSATASTASKNLPHYGDWPAAFQPGALVYYEKYLFVDRTTKKAKYACYGFEGANVKTTLINDSSFKAGSTRWVFDVSSGGSPTGQLVERTGNNEDIIVVGDGYGVVYEGELPGAVTAKLLLPDKNKPRELWDSKTCNLGGTKHEVKTSSKDYFLYPLDKKTFSNTKFVNSDSYYLAIDINNTVTKNENGGTVTVQNTDSYFFNPHFAKTVRRAGTSVMPVAPSATNSTNYIYLRTGRQLNNLSRYYEHDGSGAGSGYREVTKECIFTQQRNIAFTDYEWGEFASVSPDPETGKTVVTSQAPIGTAFVGSFVATYDGGCNMITDVSFVTKQGDYVGMFGYLGESAELKNVVLCTDYQPRKGVDESTIESLKHTYYVQRKGAMQKNEKVHMGVLAGYNKGTITNCAAAGYYLAGEDGTVHAYTGSSSNIGGLVGTNEGSITDCSADSPKLRLSLFEATANAAGFVGVNTSTGVIDNCYALGAIDVVEAPRSTVSVAGFAGNNQGLIKNSYSATAVASSGSDTKVYGFSPAGGLARSCQYLNGGTYTYVQRLYAFNFNTDSNYGAGVPIRYGELKKQSSQAPVSSEHSYAHSLTQTEERNAAYPYRGVVTGAGSKPSAPIYVHYGNWQDDAVLGTLGIFYWEHEEASANGGYHMTYLGSSEEKVDGQYKPEFSGGSSLCNSHDDGGIITEYGYGVYVREGEEQYTTVSLKYLSSSASVLGSAGSFTLQDLKERPQFYNADVSEELATQLENIDTTDQTFSFFAFTTRSSGSEYICLDSGVGPDKKSNVTNDQIARQNGSVTLAFKNTESSKDASYTYEISPFFANAMSLSDVKIDGKTTDRPAELTMKTAADEREIDCLLEPGKRIDDSKKVIDNPNHYEVRSLQQLQYINWNAATRSVETLVWGDSGLKDDGRKAYPYLQYATTTGFQPRGVAENETSNHTPRTWLQTHDLQGKGGESFAPIAGAATSSHGLANGSYESILYAWFGGAYDGQSYTIKNASIRSNSYYVGLFAVTAGASIKNVILYGDSDEAVIERVDTRSRPASYVVGSLVGVAVNYSGEKPIDNVITNCAISGYKVVDSSENPEALGEVCIGGLVGVASVNLQNCSAAADIVVRPDNHSAFGPWGDYIRVGGLVGGLFDTVSNCYTGGSISVEGPVLKATNTGPGTPADPDKNEKARTQYSSHIFIAGIAGSAFSSTIKNFGGSGDSRSMKVYNSYTYTSFPTMEGTIRSISMIASLADRHSKSTNPPILKGCYYYDKRADFVVERSNYYFTNNKNTFYNKYFNPENDEYSRDAMIKGDVKYLRQYLGDGNNAQTGKGPALDKSSSVKAKTYAEMVKDSFVTLLNTDPDDSTVSDSPWGLVSKKDKNDVSIDGKFSFPADANLEGMNYPFPTVITQNDLTFGTASKPVLVNVHYGDWPLNGSHWSSGRATMDIFSDMGEDGYAYKTLMLYVDTSTYKGPTNKEAIEALIKPDVDDMVAVSVEDIKDTGQVRRYQVTLKALKEGFVTLKFNEDDEPTARCTLHITANWVLSAEGEDGAVYDSASNTLRLSQVGGSTAQIKLMAHDASKAKDYTAAVIWNETAPVVEDGASLICDNNDGKGAMLKVTRVLDNSTAVIVTARYTYITGAVFTQQLFIDVKPPFTLGLTNNVTGTAGGEYCEVTLGEADHEGKEPADGMKPSRVYDPPVNFYLYAKKDARSYLNNPGNIEGITVTEGSFSERLENGEPGQRYFFELNNSANTSGDFACLGGTLYRTTDSVPMSDPKITVHLQGGYTLSVTVPKTSIQLIELFVLELDTGSKSDKYVINTHKDGTTSWVPTYKGADYYKKDGSGWTFEGWYAEKSSSAEMILDSSGAIVCKNYSGIVSGGQFLQKGSAILHARWTKQITTNIWKPVTETVNDGLYLLVSAPSAGKTGAILYQAGTDDNTTINRGVHFSDDFVAVKSGNDGLYIEGSFPRNYLWKCSDLGEGKMRLYNADNPGYMIADNNIHNGEWTETICTENQLYKDEKNRAILLLAGSQLRSNPNSQNKNQGYRISYNPGKAYLLAVNTTEGQPVELYGRSSETIDSFSSEPELLLRNGWKETSVPLATAAGTVPEAAITSNICELIGWYDKVTQDGTMVLDSSGKVVANPGTTFGGATVTDDQTLALSDNATLYAKWRTTAKDNGLTNKGKVQNAFVKVQPDEPIVSGGKYAILEDLGAMARNKNDSMKRIHTLVSSNRYVFETGESATGIVLGSAEARWVATKPPEGEGYLLAVSASNIWQYLFMDSSNKVLANNVETPTVWMWNNGKLYPLEEDASGKSIRYDAVHPDHTDGAYGNWILDTTVGNRPLTLYRYLDSGDNSGEGVYKVSWDAH